MLKQPHCCLVLTRVSPEALKLTARLLHTVSALIFASVGSLGPFANESTAFSAEESSVPNNIVFIMVDDLGYMDIGANNPETFYETPNVDKLAATGMRFTNAYAACCVCSPTRASIMTGKYPARLKTTDFFCGKRAGHD